MPTAIDFLGIWEEAHKDCVTTSEQEKAAYLLGTIGPRIAAAALGLSDARQLKSWAREQGGGGPREAIVAKRLDVLFQATRAISNAYSAAVAARFLRSANPQLDDLAPLEVLGDARDDDGLRQVLVATRAFLEG